MDQAAASGANEALFDETGRRIPYSGMRVHNQVSRGYFRLLQPPVDDEQVVARTVQYLGLAGPPVSAGAFQEILAGLRSQPALRNLTKAVHVPFLCPPTLPGAGRGEDLGRLLEAVNRSFTARFPESDFRDLCPGKPDDSATPAPGSRYERFEAARGAGYVMGIYFPNCLAEYDLASQRSQMATLPETVACGAGTAQLVLSGPAEAAAALIGSPDLLWNEANYPHHLCLSGIQEPGDGIVYTFEAYGNNLRFRYRSNMLTPEVTQVSEQWAGGLTVFVG